MNPDMSLQCLAHWPSTKGQKVMEESAHQPCKKRKPSKSQCQNQALSKKEKFPHLNSEDITTEVTCLSE